jgi:uncharacterized protein (TIGR00297 family)
MRSTTATYQAWAVIIGFVPAAFILYFGPRLPVGNIVVSAAVSAVFALFAWLLGGVYAAGALAGFAIAFTLYMSRGWQMFAVLFCVFVLTWAATRVGYARKRVRGLAESESKSGRSAAQVVANVGLAAFAIPIATHSPELVLPATWAAVAVLAEAAADTCSSEIGKAYGRKTVLLTTWQPVPPGTDGGVSWIGMAAALSASTLVSGSAFALGILTLRGAVWVALAGVLGTLLDSLLGATLERRGLLNNDAVNLLGTATAGTLAACFCALAA